MNPKEMAALFTERNAVDESKQYLRSEGLLDLVRHDEHIEGRYLPDYRDLARLHLLIRKRKAFTVLEFGIGHSALIMADALARNKADWDALTEKPEIRNSNPFELHSVNADPVWNEVVQSSIPSRLMPYITVHHIGVSAGLFQDRDCHFYNELPDMVPDLIYLDGPHPKEVASTVSVRWSAPDKMVMAGDLLRMEPWLLPGTCLVVDGRTANVRFLCAHFYRNWSAARNETGDVSILELQEPPLGRYNRNSLRYCLGDRIEHW